MYIYILNLFLIIILSIIIKNTESKKIKLRLVIIYFLQLFIISVLRNDSVGIDLINYKIYFKDISTMEFPTITYMNLEKGYIFLNSLISTICNNFRGIILIVAAISLGAVSKLIYDYSENVALSFYLFITMGFFANSLNLYRQILAIAFVLISIRYIVKDSILKFVICIIIAMTFHTTAIVFLPMYFIRNIKLNPLVLINVGFGIIFLIVFSKRIIYMLMSNKYAYYNNDIISGEGYKLLALYIIIMFFAFKFKDKLYERNNGKLVNIMIIASLSTIICQILATKFSLFSRITIYFSILFIILIPNMINCIENKWFRLLIKYAVLIVFLIIYLTDLIKDSSGIVPYII